MDTFASPEDVVGRFWRDLTDIEESQVDALLELATLLIAEAVDEDAAWVDALDPVPPALRLICIEAVIRVLQNPSGATSVQETLGAYSHSERYDSAGAAGIGLYLSAADRRRIRRAINGGLFTAVTLETPYSGTGLDDQPELPL